MAVLDRILRAGEGKKLRALAGLVPEINKLEPDMEALSDGELQAKTAEFQQRYRAELAGNPALAELRGFARAGDLTLVYSAKDEQHNDAVVLKQILDGA